MMNNGEFDVENMSDDEFIAAWRSLATEMDKDASATHSMGGDIPGAHYTAGMYKLTTTDRLTYGAHAGIAFCDPYGNVVSSQIGRSEACVCGIEHEMATDEWLGLIITINGQRGFIPLRIMSGIMARVQDKAAGTQDIDPKLEVWE